MKKTLLALLVVCTTFTFCRKATIDEVTSGSETLSEPVPSCYYPAVNVSTFVGSGTPGHADGTTKTAGVGGPMAMASFNGILYFSSSGRLRKIEGSMVTTFFTHSAPMGLSFIVALATDYDGNIYAGYSDFFIQKISPAGEVLATYGVPGMGGYSALPPYRFGTLGGLAVDLDNRLYISDHGNKVVRRLDPDGSMVIIAGQVGVAGTEDGPVSLARFGYNLSDIAVSPYGDRIYIADDTRVRVISGGYVSTIAGSTSAGHVDGNGPAARFGKIGDLDIDAGGNLYLGEYYNSYTGEYAYVRKIIRMRTGLIAWKVTTLAGGERGFANGSGAAARFDGLWGIVVNSSATTIYAADYDNNRIRRLSLTCAPVF
jgi:hypothetical protein